MHFTLRQLQIFLATAQHQTVTRAADALSMSQSAASGALRDLGFDVSSCEHPIIPVHFRRHKNDAHLAQTIAADLLDEGVYCIGFSFPVVPVGQARIRLQASAAHTDDHVTRCLEAFARVGRKHGAI